MSYIKRDDIPVAAGEAALELSGTADLVAVQCTRTPQAGGISYAATARAITQDGLPVLSAGGDPISTSLTHTDRDAAAADSVARACLLAVLGEPVTAVQWGSDFLRDVSIRNAISINNVAHVVDAAQVL